MPSLNSARAGALAGSVAGNSKSAAFWVVKMCPLIFAKPVTVVFRFVIQNVYLPFCPQQSSIVFANAGHYAVFLPVLKSFFAHDFQDVRCGWPFLSQAILHAPNPKRKISPPNEVCWHFCWHFSDDFRYAISLCKQNRFRA